MWRQTNVCNWISNGKFTACLSNYDKSGDTKTAFVTIVTNVATEKIWLDTTGLEHST